MERWMVRFFIKHLSLWNALYVCTSPNILIQKSFEIFCFLVIAIGNYHRDKCGKCRGCIWELWKKLWGRKSFKRHTKFLGFIFWQASNKSFRHISATTSFTSDISRYKFQCIKRRNLSKRNTKNYIKTNLIINYRLAKLWRGEKLKSKLPASIWVGAAKAYWRSIWYSRNR